MQRQQQQQQHVGFEDVVSDTVARSKRAVFVEWSGQPTGRWSQSRLSSPPWERASRQRVQSRAQGGDSATDVFLSCLLPDEEFPVHGEDLQEQECVQRAGGEDPQVWARIESVRRSSAAPSPIDFEYVVREQQKTRVAFGSAQSRAVQPLAGLAGGATRLANMSLRTTNDLQHLGPSEHTTPNLNAFYEILNRVTSIKGYGPGARTAPRFKDIDFHLPAPNAYDVDAVQPKVKCRPPFNSTSRRKMSAVPDTPGPGTYSLETFKGPGVPVVVLCVGGEGPGRCEVCDNPLQQGVEFWATERLANIMCQECMFAARKSRKLYRWQLEAYKKTRDCSDIHRHEGTTAKIYLVDPATVEKRRRREKYLSKYFREQSGAGRDVLPSYEPARLVEVDPDAARVGVAAIKDDYCCLHEAFNSFNKDRMSFGLREPSNNEIIYNTLKRCALDRQPSPFSTAAAEEEGEGKGDQ